jgi:drug/metabolite transporter (DMT)-like permease
VQFQARVSPGSLGVLAATVAAVTWGFTGIFVSKSVTEPLLLTFYRLWLAAALMCGVSLLRRRMFTWAVFRSAIPAGAFLSLNLVLYVFAFRLTDVATASVIGALQPAVVLLLAGPLLGETATWRDLSWTALATVGVVTVVLGSGGSGGNHLNGDLFATVGTLAFVGYWLAGKRARLNVDAFEFTSAVWLVAAIAITPVTLIFGPPLGHVAAADWRWIALLTVVPGSGHLLMIWAHRAVDAAVSAMIGTGNVIVAALAAMTFLRQPLTAIEIAGGLVAVAAIAMLAMRQARRSHVSLDDCALARPVRVGPGERGAHQGLAASTVAEMGSRSAMSWSSSLGSRVAYAGAARRSVSDSICSLVVRPASLSQPEASMRPRARIPSTTLASRSAGRWWILPNFSAGMFSESAWSTWACVPPMPAATRAAM